jgi:hypothetical protein
MKPAVEITPRGSNNRSDYYQYGGSNITVAHTQGRCVCLTCLTADSCEHAKAVREYVEAKWANPMTAMVAA